MGGNPTLFYRVKSIVKIFRKINIDVSFLIDPLITNNAIYRNT